MQATIMKWRETAIVIGIATEKADQWNAGVTKGEIIVPLYLYVCSSFRNLHPAITAIISKGSFRLQSNDTCMVAAVVLRLQQR